MKDEALATPPELSPADAAVNYLLQRIRVDVDLRSVMIGTEAFHRLCVAEAERTAVDLDIVESRYATLAKHCEGEKSRLAHLRDEMGMIYEICNEDGSQIDRLRRIGEIADRGRP